MPKQPAGSPESEEGRVRSSEARRILSPDGKPISRSSLYWLERRGIITPHRFGGIKSYDPRELRDVRERGVTGPIRLPSKSE